MKYKKIGSITPIWNQELFIGPHFDMLSSLDKNVVMLQQQPLEEYEKEHGIGEEPDRSVKIFETLLPHVETHLARYKGMFGCGLFNEALPFVQDCDIVFKIDPDILLLPDDWKTLVDFVKNTDYDAYYFDYRRCSVNYYVTGRYDRGVMNALEEKELMAFNPKMELAGVLDYNCADSRKAMLPCVMMHHLRGWNKPKSLKEGWAHSEEILYNEYGEWREYPEPLREVMNEWLEKLNEI